MIVKRPPVLPRVRDLSAGRPGGASRIAPTLSCGGSLPSCTHQPGQPLGEVPIQRRMLREGAEIDRAGIEVDDQVQVQIGTEHAVRPAPRDEFARMVAARDQEAPVERHQRLVALRAAQKLGDHPADPALAGLRKASADGIAVARQAENWGLSLELRLCV